MKGLDKAAKLVYGDRAEQYGPWDENAQKVAAMFETVAGVKLTPPQVTLFMVCLKLAREGTKTKEDNTVDTMGYLELYYQQLYGNTEQEGKMVMIPKKDVAAYKEVVRKMDKGHPLSRKELRVLGRAITVMKEKNNEAFKT